MSINRRTALQMLLSGATVGVLAACGAPTQQAAPTAAPAAKPPPAAGQPTIVSAGRHDRAQTGGRAAPRWVSCARARWATSSRSTRTSCSASSESVWLSTTG